METNIVVEGIKFMILGMGIVFVFLGIMIVVMNVMSRLIHKYFPEPHPGEAVIGSAPAPAAEKKKIVAAIVAAIIEDKKSQA